LHPTALRERAGAVLLLADRFVREFGERMGKADVGLSREARDLLLAYAWPGNIRELQNAIERAVILSDGGLISAAQLGVTPAASPLATSRAADEPSRAASSQTPPPVPPDGEGLPEMEKRAVMEALKRSNGNRSKAAAALGLSRTRFYTLLRRFGLD